MSNCIRKYLLSLASLAVCLSASAYKPAGDKIMTTWGVNINPQNVLPEYPRPQMTRDRWLNLNGLWQYAITDINAKAPAKYDGEILVPFAVESALSGVGRRVGENEALWYSRTFTLPAKWKGDDVLLNFGAVDWKAEVWVNGVRVGTHTGGYAPFSLNITEALRHGTNTLVVKVTDACDARQQPVGKQRNNSFGIWYSPVTGIWQTVWLEPVAPTHIKRLRITPDIDRRVLTVEAITDGDYKGVVEVSLTNRDGSVISGRALISQPVELEMPADAKLWSPDAPELYPLTVKLLNDGKCVDAVGSYAAFRKFSTARDGDGNMRLQLNNKNLFQFGQLDQGWWPDGLYTAPSDAALKFDLEKQKELGYNMVRKHIKVEPARWYAHCDSLGLIVWQDMPSGHGGVWYSDGYFNTPEQQFPQDVRDNFRKEWLEIMDALYSVPSIGVWVPFNEGWGQHDTVEIAELTKRHDPTRLVNPASGGNFFQTGDILDLHNYPQPKMKLRDNNRVNVLGEYGGIGMAVPGHNWTDKENFSYVALPSFDGVMNEYERLANILKEYIPLGFSAAVYTQATDVEAETNGLMTYDRKVLKVDPERIRKINRSVIETLK